MGETTDYTLSPEYGLAYSVLTDYKAYRRVVGKVSADDFQPGPCKKIFQAVEALDARDEPVELITIKAELSEDILEPFLHDLAKSPPRAENAELYANMVREEAQHRCITQLCQDVIEAKGTAQERLGRLLEGTEAIAGRVKAEGILSTSDALIDLLERLKDRVEGKNVPLTCGLDDIDKHLGGGFSPGCLYILAGRPGIGKTTLALFLADKMAEQGEVLYISLEMTPEQLTAKRMARATGIPAQRILSASRENALTQKEWDTLTLAMSDLTNKANLHVNRKMGANVSEISGMAKQIKGLRAVFVDHLGLLKVTDSRLRGRTEMVTEISGALKQLALSLEVPVIALCHLNRASEMNEGKKPSLANLRDSGSIEQDADVVMLLRRLDFCTSDEVETPQDTALLDVNFAKNRFGKNGSEQLNLYLATDRVQNVLCKG